MSHQQHTAFENVMGKGEIAQNKQFLLFPQCFLLNQIIVSPFVNIFDIKSLFADEFEELKIGISGNGVKLATLNLSFANAFKLVCSRIISYGKDFAVCKIDA